MVGAQARRPGRGGAVRVARGAAGRPRRGGRLGALHWHFVLGCWGDGVGCARGCPARASAVASSRRPRRSFVNLLMLRGDGSPALQRAEGQRPLTEGLTPSRLRRGIGRLRGVCVVVPCRLWWFSRIKTRSSRLAPQCAWRRCVPGAAVCLAFGPLKRPANQLTSATVSIICAPVDVGSRCSDCGASNRKIERAHSQKAGLHPQTRAQKSHKSSKPHRELVNAQVLQCRSK